MARPRKELPMSKHTNNACPMRKTSIGGQALIEGIMMKGPKKTAIAVRLPNGEIDVSEIKETHLKDKYKIFSLSIAS